MSEVSAATQDGYQPPNPIEVPPLYSWPLRPLATLRWIFTGLLFPWGLIFIGMAVVAWNYLTPSMDRMATLELDWMALIWLRNAALLTLVAGGLHWWLYIRRSQGQEYKYNTRWQTTNSRKFLWGNQTWDNMFWSLVSGCTIWSLYESLTLWAYATDLIPRVEWSDAPIYLAVMTIGVIFWSTFHFYLVHRALHWPRLYRVAHELHHRNANPGPWSGISMHPLEHIIYFTVLFLWWVVPVHPVIVLLTGIYQGISPAVSHSGFDQVVLWGRIQVKAGDLFHQLHHKYFEVNYGNTPTPLDKVFGSWHDGTPEAVMALKDRRQAQRILRESRNNHGEGAAPTTNGKGV
ncbi:MAG: sterol desaturase family protein [Arenicellales bacterium]|nr:sterol desaturase family protein [Arenicellales bacterium]